MQQMQHQRDIISIGVSQQTKIKKKHRSNRLINAMLFVTYMYIVFSPKFSLQKFSLIKRRKSYKETQIRVLTRLFLSCRPQELFRGQTERDQTALAPWDPFELEDYWSLLRCSCHRPEGYLWPLEPGWRRSHWRTRRTRDLLASRCGRWRFERRWFSRAARMDKVTNLVFWKFLANLKGNKWFIDQN